MIYTVGFLLLLVGLPLANALGVIDVKWKTALFPLIFLVTVFVVMFAIALALILIKAM